jgi:4-hydroxy-tetrahydrodipicolinate reductase
MRSLADRKQAGLLYGTNFSIGVQVMLQVAAKMGELLKPAGYEFSIEETHHVTKVDSPSGTAISLAEVVKKAAGLNDVPVEAHRVGDAAGTHVLVAKSAADKLVLTHDSHSRRGFAEGAVRAAEWLSTRTGCFDFQDVYTQM